jgi:hypothetical protein
MPKLNDGISNEDAKRGLQSIPHIICQRAIDRNWIVDKSGNVSIQSLCWLYCWGRTGLNSIAAANRARVVFDEIMNINYNTLDAKDLLVDRALHRWARKARNLPRTKNNDEKLKKELNEFLNL